MMVCSCKEFHDNMTQIDCAISAAWVHGVILGKDYVPFKFCPWCGEKLHLEYDEEFDTDEEDA